MPLGARYKPKDKKELLELLYDEIECRDIDFSLLTDLNNLFLIKVFYYRIQMFILSIQTILIY